MKEWLVPYKYVKKQKKRPHNEGVKLLRQVSYRLETYRAVCGYNILSLIVQAKNKKMFESQCSREISYYIEVEL